jgi:hypothetical protein
LLDSIVCLFPQRFENYLSFTLDQITGMIYPTPSVPHRNDRKERRNFVKMRYAVILELVEKAIEFCPSEKEGVVQLDGGKSFPKDPFPDYVAAFNDASPIDLTELEEPAAGNMVES